jgi:hypothetical protein
MFESKANPGPLAEMVNPTLSAVDLNKMGKVKEAYGALSEKLAAALKEKPLAKKALRQAIGETQAYAENNSTDAFYGDYRDVGHFAKKLKEDVRLGEDVHKAADALLAGIGEAVLDTANHGAFKENSTGLTAYLPLDAGYDLHNSWRAPRGFDPLHGFNDTSVSQNSKMNEVLKGISEEGKFNARLRGLGLGNVGIVRTHKALSGLKALGKFALGIASNIGALHGWAYARGNDPGGAFGIPANVAVGLAPVGGLRKAVQGTGTIIGAVRNDNLANKGQAITGGAMEIVSGAAVTGAAGLHLAEMFNFDTGYGHLKQPLGIVAVGAPIANSVIGAVATRKNAVAAKEEALSMTPEQRQFQLQNGTQKEYYVPSFAKFLVNAAGGGAMDTSKAKA